MDEFLELVNSKYQENDLITKAYNFACKAHKNQKRVSGEPYIIHPIAVATILIDLGLDQETISAALLHDVVEDTPTSFKKIREEFGGQVELLVKGVSKINSIKYSKSEIEMDSLKRMLIAMSKDIRVILIKLADRLHNIRTIDALSQSRQIRICTETRNLFIPLAERLGLNTIRLEMEDKCFKILNPKEYDKLKKELDRKYVKTTERMKSIQEILENCLKEANINGEVKSRLKHFYSLYKKIKDKGTAKIYDIIAFRIIVDNQDDCYRILGEVHKLYKPVPGRIKDYIAAPKSNGYRSLHTTLLTKDGTPFEIQIRTHLMHQYCEYGIAAHWRYKTGDKKKDILEDKLNWIRSIIEDERQIKDSENFVKALQMDFSTSEIWVFTPNYKPISLPENATPIDMAYAIHTELGNTCVGAKVNGRKVPLTSKLDTGDVVEIITSNNSKGPSRDWLKIAVSTNARSHIRNFFKKSMIPENVTVGKQVLEEKALEVHVPFGNIIGGKVFEEIKKKYLVYSLDDMFSSIATGGIKPIDIINIAMITMGGVKEEKSESPVYIEGSDIEGVKFARCCNPIPGDKIVGISSNNGITVHCEDCVNIRNMDKERYLSSEWKEGVQRDFETSFRIVGKDRDGVLSEIISTIYEENMKLNFVNARVIGGGKFEIILNVFVKNRGEADDIAEKISKIECVQVVNRNNLN